MQQASRGAAAQSHSDGSDRVLKTRLPKRILCQTGAASVAPVPAPQLYACVAACSDEYERVIV